MQEYLTQTIRDFFKLRPIIGEKEYTIQISAYLQTFIPTKQTPVRMQFSCLSHRKRKNRMQSIFCKRMNSW